MILDGKLVRQELLKKLYKKYENINPGLVVIQVGDDFASTKYIRQKEKLANELGVNFKLLKYDNIRTSELVGVIEKLNDNQEVDGIIVQLPLPKTINYDLVRNSIDPKKDIDGVNDENRVALLDNNENGMIPCTALGIIKILDYYNIDVSGKDVVIIGRSIHIGLPLYSLLLNRDATITMCHSKTKDIKKYTKNADIIISSVGKPNFITQDMVREDVCLIDVGFNYYNGKICGDVSQNLTKYKYLTPVPGGVGQMTVYSIYENLYKAYYLNRKDNKKILLKNS